MLINIEIVGQNIAKLLLGGNFKPMVRLEFNAILRKP